MAASQKNKGFVLLDDFVSDLGQSTLAERKSNRVSKTGEITILDEMVVLLPQDNRCIIQPDSANNPTSL
jgi:hypothetical protein